MDIERNSKSSRLSRLSSQQPQDRSSFRSEVMSLERLSGSRAPSLSRRVSLVNAMDLEVSNRSAGQDDFLLDPDDRFCDLQQSGELQRLSGQSRGGYSFAADVEEKDLRRQSQCRITHECGCGGAEECLRVHCSCFLTPREICVIGQCCPACIASKNEYLQATRGFQVGQRGRGAPPEDEALLQLIKQRNCKNMHYMKQVYANEPCMKDLLFCTCKKSHCQKKYCLCFQRGQKCGEFCICLQCENREDEDEDYFREEEQRRWERYATYKPYDEQEDKDQIDPDIEQFLEQPPPQERFNLTMEFEPVDFDSALHDR